MEIKKKLLDIVHDKIRFKHYSIKKEKSYVKIMEATFSYNYIIFKDYSVIK